MNRKLYEVTSLPDTVVLGRQTESGVLDVRIDCTGWLTFWPNLTLSIWVTPPGGDASYLAATRMDGKVLVWPVSNVDTAEVGYGKMEVVGTAAGQRKLSSIAKTQVMPTTTTKVTNPPAKGQSFLDQMTEATAKAEAATAEAKTATAQANAAAKLVNDNVEAVESDIAAKGAVQVSVIEQKGAQTLATIPEEYADLDAEVKSLKDTTVNQGNRLASVDGVIPWPEFEPGQMYVDGGKLVYGARSGRYRMKQGTFIRLNEGDVIVSADQDTYMFYGAYYVNGVYTTIGGRKVNLTAAVDGDFYITIARNDGVAITDDNLAEAIANFAVVRAGTLVQRVEALESSDEAFGVGITDNAQRLADVDGVVWLPEFEYGSVECIPATGFSYTSAKNRIRTPEGVTVPVKKGDVIKSSDWAKILCYGGYKNAAGEYVQFTSFKDDLDIPEDGELVLSIADSTATSTPIENIKALASLLYIYRVDNLRHEVENGVHEALAHNCEYYANGLMRRAYNPYQGGGDMTLTGQLHCHSKYKDETTGEIIYYDNGSLAAAIQGHKDSGYDFLTITDYGHTGEMSRPTDAIIPDGLTWLFNSQEAAIEGSATANSGLYPTKHSCVYNSREVYDWQEKMHWQTWADMTKPYGEMVSIAHPFWADTYQPYEVLDRIKGRIRFCEIYNGVIQTQFVVKTPDGKGTDYAWEYLLDKGLAIWGTAVSDAHRCNAGAEMKNGCVKVFAPENERFAIWEALCKGNFYAASNVDANINGVSFENGVLTIATGDAGASTQFLKEGGEVVKTVTGANPSYAMTGGEKYVRAVVTLSNGHTVWTQPIINIYKPDYDVFVG